MLIPLILGCTTLLVSMTIQVVVVVMMIRYLIKTLRTNERKLDGFGFNIYVIGVVLLILFAGNMVQMAIWATLFIYLGEFSDFLTAFYHSMVNFSSLGYGDIVMSEEWRLLGAIESSNGVLMLGLTSGAIFAVMSRLFIKQQAAGELLDNKQR